MTTATKFQGARNGSRTPLAQPVWQPDRRSASERYRDLTVKIYTMLGFFPFEVYCRLAFIDERKPAWGRSEDLVPIFFPGLYPEDEWDTKQHFSDLRLLWCVSAAIAAGACPNTFGAASPSPLRPIVLDREVRPQFARPIAFGGLPSWKNLPCVRGFVGTDQFDFLAPVERRTFQPTAFAGGSNNIYYLHATGTTALVAVLQSALDSRLDRQTKPAALNPSTAAGETEDLSDAELQEVAELMKQVVSK